MKAVTVGICGLGTVGSGTFNILVNNRQSIGSHANSTIEIVQVGARRDNPSCDLKAINVTRDIFEVAANPAVDIVVELIGGTTVAKELVLTAINNGKHVVTANKALIAEYGNTIFAQAKANGVTVAYEAAIAGGIPIIKVLREGLAANRIDWLAGIINGTGNFILTEMQGKNRDFADVLKEAQALGYAEADPTFDVEGIDAAHKLAILASIAFGMPLACNKVFTEGIGAIEAKDIAYAKELGYRIKHLGIARKLDDGIELRVHPTLIPEKRLIANVDGVLNAVLVNGDAVGSTMYCGAGAGALPTASAVVADIIDIARQIVSTATSGVPALGTVDIVEQTILPIEAIHSVYYLRLLVDDKPGVLSQLTTILSEAGISVEVMHQNEPAETDAGAEIVLLTNVIQEASLLKAVASLEKLDVVQGSVHKIRVESLA